MDISIKVLGLHLTLKKNTQKLNLSTCDYNSQRTCKTNKKNKHP